METVKFCFDIVCYIATSILLINCLLMYNENEDVSEILYKEYNVDSQTRYPSITLCFALTPNLIKTEELKKYGNELNGSSYEAFLMGHYWNEKMLNISYEEVTESLEKYVLDAITKEAFGDGVPPNIITGFRATTLPSYFRIYKCLTFDMPHQSQQKTKLASIILSNSIFFNGIIPATDGLLSNLHLPDEMLANALATKWTRKQRKNVSEVLQQRFNVISMTLLRRRNKTRDICQHYNNFDNDYKEAIIAKVGCIPPYWKSSQRFDKCRTAEEMQMIAKYAFKGYSGSSGLEKILPKSCVELKKLLYKSDDADVAFNLIQTKNPELIITKVGNENVTNFMVTFEDAGIKEIKQVQAFGIASLVGNVGGYIGLFLGFSIIQFPSFCVFMNQKLVSWCGRNRKPGSNGNSSECNTIELKGHQKDKQMAALEERIQLIEEKLTSFYVKSQ